MHFARFTKLQMNMEARKCILNQINESKWRILSVEKSINHIFFLCFADRAFQYIYLSH
jgi:hypothetical protein